MRHVCDAVTLRERWASGLKRLGVLGFLFFLAKGLAWLLVPAALMVLGLGAE